MYDSHAIRGFIGIDLACEAAPDATTLLKFRRLLEDHGLTGVIFETINAHLAQQGLLLREGTLVDATIIGAPPSTKKRPGARPGDAPDQEGQQVALRDEGAHRGRPRLGGGAHGASAPPANVNDVTQAHGLLHGQETDALADAGYRGVAKRRASGHAGHLARGDAPERAPGSAR